MIEPFNLPGCDFLDTFEFRFAAATVITTVMMWLVAKIRDRLLGTRSSGLEFVGANLVATKQSLPMAPRLMTDTEVEELGSMLTGESSTPELSQEAKDWVLLLEDPCRPWRLKESDDNEIELDGLFNVYVTKHHAYLRVKNQKTGAWVCLSDLFTSDEVKAIAGAARARRDSLKHFKDQNDRRARLGVEKEVMAQAFSFRGRGA